jgi:acyl-CoA thioesterase FadM
VAVEDFGPASISLAQAVYKNGQEKPLCKGIVKIASLKATNFKPCGIPVPIREILTHEK